MVGRRVDVRAILADPVLRRRLMIATIQATQNREGIGTTEEQAGHAFDAVEGLPRSIVGESRSQGKG